MSPTVHKEDAVEKTILAALEETKGELARFDEQRKPLVERVQKYERIAAELGAGPLKSDGVKDSEIVAWVRENASEGERVLTRDVAEAFGGDGRGFARRLKRMAEQDPPMLWGDKNEGYYVDGYSFGESVEKASSSRRRGGRQKVAS